MTSVRESKDAMTVVAYRGDAKTLLAFDLTTEASRKRLAGFTIAVKPPGKEPYYLWNRLQFRKPEDHAQDPDEPARSTINAPLHKFRWVHVPGLEHQGLKPAMGDYVYTVTPRYFDDQQHLLPIDPGLSVDVTIAVEPFSKGSLKLAFTRGFTQSQAFVEHFGLKTKFKPANAPLQFDTSAIAGTNPAGETFTYAQQYEWSGFTARDRVFDILRAVDADATLTMDLFAYDLSEPDVLTLLLAIGPRARVILDDAGLHHSAKKPPEDRFAELFEAAAGAQRIKRGNFDRYAHDKVIVVYQNDEPVRVLTGSTNLSVTGIYVNSNHVLVYEDAEVAKLYADLFQTVWDQDVAAKPFRISKFATGAHSVGSAAVPTTSFTFAPHIEADARSGLVEVVARANKEADEADKLGSVLFAVMELQGAADNPVYTALSALHDSQTVFSYGISDNPAGIALYPVGKKGGVLVTGKPQKTRLPPPFNQVPNIGFGHQVHHKFVVCGFNGPDPTVFCGSSNLSLLGEQENGDNLLTIRDADVAACFAIEALALVDHFNFLDSTATEAAKNTDQTKDTVLATPPANKSLAAIDAGWFLGTTDVWAAKYFAAGDLHEQDRRLFVR
ncbi:phospholipase D-like domain-containing protein [Mesorhizobium sp. VK23B]|uniref:phospholipase D n=1 Tax=Mesorhizobium dulcispinae TaxID=3072316 RepID=A0ABU4XD67_9HYPH|nr:MULTISPECIES: phospholipase D-like domain-containing protein [unclassified Mesorhizobium]MDX8466157.1 phospholipase D-like domain-containing protein [Mesorhizobium sp. VK23B]MDX8471968.1 phospholipase D-like domain-containing protein [Mesorhizobium sp. VK23A]